VGCSVETELCFSDLTQNIFGPLQNQRYPISATLELTERCNYNCVQCFINKAANDPLASQKEMSTAQVKDLIDQLAEAGTLFLLITGGEPFLRSDFIEIFKYSRNKGLLVTLFSNGSMLTPEIASVLAEYGIRGLEITLYGATREIFDSVTRRPGSYERCMQGIGTALAYKLPLSLKTFVINQNKHELAQMREFAHERNLGFRFDSMLIPRLDGNGNGHHLQLDIDEMIPLDLEDPERVSAWKDVITERKGLEADRVHIYKCGAAHQSFHIDAYGDLSPCALVRTPCYNVFEIGFKNAWEMLGGVRTLKQTKKTECADCPHVFFCNQCTGWSQLMVDDPETPVPFICELTKRRLQEVRKFLDL